MDRKKTCGTNIKLKHVCLVVVIMTSEYAVKIYCHAFYMFITVFEKLDSHG